MECPNCTAPVAQAEEPDGSLNIYCPSCGWGADSSGPPEPAAPPTRPSAWLVLGLWLLSAVVVLGPYFGLRFGVPYMLDVGTNAFDEATSRFIAVLNVHYWWVIALYIFLSGVFTPNVRREDMGWFGGWVDNPFSWEDDWERQKFGFAVMFAPGKTVWAAAIMTYRLLAPR